MKQATILLLILMARYLTGCLSESSELAPAGAGVGGAAITQAAPQATTPPMVPYFAIENQPGKSEQHAVAKRENCSQMEARFKAQGRKIRLKKIRLNENPGATLPYICEFEGEDAADDTFEDYRYNSRDEYESAPPSPSPDPASSQTQPDPYQQSPGYARTNQHPHPQHREFRRSRWQR
jgi:hypothetical protein